MQPLTPNILTLAITTYNRPDKCLESLEYILNTISISRYPVSLLIVDDNSSMSTSLDKLYAYAFSNHIVVLRQPTNLGLPAARNLAIKHCNTDWIGFCDDDDCWTDQSFNTFLASITYANKSSAQMIIGISSPSGCIRDATNTFDVTRLSDLFIRGYTPPPSAQLFNLDLLRNTRLFNQDLSSGVDHDLWVALLDSCNPSVVVAYDVNVLVSGNISGRMTTNYTHRVTAIERSLASWQSVISSRLSPDFFNHFVLCYATSHNYQFFIQSLKGRNYLLFIRLMFSRGVFHRLIRRVLRGSIARDNFFDAYRM